MHRSLAFIILLFVHGLLDAPARAQETGGDLGAPPQESSQESPRESLEESPQEAPEEATSVDPAVLAPSTTPTPNTPAPNTPGPQPSNEDIPPPPQGGYTVPTGYGNAPPPTFVPTQAQFQPSFARRRVRVRVRDGAQIPADAHIFERRSRFLIIAGVIAFGVSYGISVAAASIDDERLLYTPLLGPLLWQLDEGNSDTAALMVLLTLAQTAGTLLFGFGMRKKKYAEWYAGDRRISLAALPSRHGAALTLNIR